MPIISNTKKRPKRVAKTVRTFWRRVSGVLSVDFVVFFVLGFGFIIFQIYHPKYYSR
ncbi:MAG: hypothetical protein KatS3mg087_1945 [Patescibacteria group bacterium]|nr:MAG: hypothetical protein KatS3mg087_1945 [Patescibacteria group bacterium]